MGNKQKTLARLLSEVGTVTNGRVAYPRHQQVAASKLAAEVTRVYRALGGTLPTVTVNFKGWDIEFDGIAVELDEQLHFNRYRALTLASEIYSQLPGFPLNIYRRYCDLYEGECVRAGSFGRKWTSPSCEEQFGLADPPGTFGNHGAPRWKQRAFYDFIKDLSPLLVGVRVARISIWDKLGDDEALLGTVLERADSARLGQIADLVRSRWG